MRAFFRLVFIILLFGVVQNNYGQTIEVHGKIIDKETQEPIPFANIALKEIYKGTASNELGEFSFKIDSLPVLLTISHLSYESLEIELLENKPLIIEMIPGKLLLDELVIKGKGNDEYAYGLIERAYYKIMGKSTDNYGKAFYRQISKNGDEYSELYEIFYDTRYSNNGVEDWAIQEGRYALKLSTADSFIYNKNFTLMIRLLTIVQPETEDLIMPVSDKVREQFYLITDQIMAVNERRVAQIRFEKKETITFPAMKGEIWIDADSYEVLKLSGVIENDDLKFITLKGKSSSWKNYQVSCELAFKPLDEDLALDYVRLNQQFDYYVDDVYTNKVETTSFLTYYEYYTPPKMKKLGGRLLRFRQRDADVLDNIGYNQLFWDENIIVKRTPVEAEVIQDFEEERAFGSIYLNNKNQVILEDYKLDNDPFIVHVKQQLNQLNLPRNGEKVYIHHDKPMYVAGEKIWFKSYILNMASNVPVDRSGVLYLDLVSPDGSTLISQSHYIHNGNCHGSMPLPGDLESGKYTLLAFTERMKSMNKKFYFRQELEIMSASDRSGLMKRTVYKRSNSLELNAEGGTMIENMPTQIGFIATDIFGEPLDVKGKIIDGEGQLISSFKNEFNGMGSMFINPNSLTEYNTMIMSHEVGEVEFPKISMIGYSILTNNLKPNTIDIAIRGSLKLEGKKFYLLVISDGVLFDRRIGMLTRGLYKTEIPKSNLPEGIAQLLLIDELGKIQGKRLIFINHPEAGFAKYYMAKKEFKRRERIDLVIELNDENGKALKNASVSVSVLDRDKVERKSDQQNIRSYLNLEYLLDSKLEKPAELFNDFDRETMKKLEWLMLNQQTVLPEIHSFDSMTNSEQLPDVIHSGLTLSGLAVNQQTDQPLSNGYITAIYENDPSMGSWYIRTDEQGRFSIEGIHTIDSIRALIIAKDAQGKLTKTRLIFDDARVSDQLNEFANVAISNDASRYLEQYVKTRQELKGFNLEETGENQFEEIGLNTTAFGQADQEVTIDEKYLEKADLFHVFSDRFPGVTVTNDGEKAEIKLRGENGEPVLVMDGLILCAPEADSLNYFTVETGNLQKVLSGIEPGIIQRIEIIKPGSIAANFPFDVTNGIIVLYGKHEKNPYLEAFSDNLSSVWIPGFTAPELFPSPDYSAREEGDYVPDLRSTLYWNPDVTTNRRGRAKIGFYNSDDTRTFQICIEGITEDGLPIFDLYEFGRNARGQIN